MADGIIQVPADGAGKKIDTEEITVGANSVHRERHQIAGAGATDIAPVTAAGGLLVTANLSATDNAVLDTIDAVLDTIKTDSAALVVDAAASEALLITIDADTGGILTAVQLLDNAISGSEMQVDVVAALPAGTNNIGDVDVLTLPALPAGSNNIGDVDVLSIIPGTGATNQGKAIDSVAGATDTGVAALAVRDDALTTLTPVDGDYVPLRVNSTGALHVTGGGGGTEYTEDAASAADPVGQMMMAVRRDTLSASEVSTTGDNIALKATNKGELHTSNVDLLAAVTASYLPFGAGTAAAAGRVTLASDDPAVTALQLIDNAISGSEMQVDVVAALPAGDNNIGNVDIVSGVITTVSSVTAIANALPAGANAIGKLAANTGVDIGDVDVTSIIPGTGATNQGKAVDAVAGATDTGVAVLVVRDDALTTLTPIDGDYTHLRVNSTGALHTQATIGSALPAGTNNIGDVDVITLPALVAGTANIGDVDVLTLPALPAGTNAIGKLLPSDVDVTTHTNYAKKYYTNAGAVTDGIIWSPAAGKRWHVATLYINVSAAATVTLEDDLAGGDSPVWKGEFAANSGVVIPFGDKYPLASGEDAADLIITTTAGNVYCTAVGYEI